MKAETKQIALASFIGGALFCAVALMFTPKFWWLGFISGIAGGYLSYEFREVLDGFKIAFKEILEFYYAVHLVLTEITKYITKIPHPFFFPSLIFSLPMTKLLMELLIMEEKRIARLNNVNYSPDPIIYSVFEAVLFISILIIGTITIFSITRYGAKLNKCYWPSEWWIILHGVNQGNTCQNLSYHNARIWFDAAVWHGVKVAWRALISATQKCPQKISYFFKLIHSYKRVLCAIDGTLGGLLSYLLLARSAGSPPEQCLLIIFGGILGMACGLIHNELAKKFHIIEVCGATQKRFLTKGGQEKSLDRLFFT